MSASERQDHVTGPIPQSASVPPATPAGTNGSVPPSAELKPFALPEGFIAPEVTALFSQWMRSSTDVVYFKDRQSRFVEVSTSKAQIHNSVPQNFFGRTDFDFLPEAIAKAAIQDEQLIMVTGRGVIDRLETETLADGNARSFLVSKLPLRDSTGQVTGLCCIQKDVTQSVATQRALESTNQQLVEATRQAGMAEVATGVLHNVGNVLTSINVTANLLSDRLRDSKMASLAKVASLLRENANDLPGFFAKDPRAAKLTSYLETLSQNLEKERQESINELATLLKSVSHVKDIIWMQQSYASVSGIVEPLPAPETIEDALKLSNNALQRHNVQVTREFGPTPPARAERHKVLQILVNLISNAKRAMDAKEPSQRKLIVRTERGVDDTIMIRVIDNGIGIPAENLGKIFSHGFTTRKDGHGFGLHSSAAAAKQMGGLLEAQSEGPGKGATFTLTLPAWSSPAAGAATTQGA
jgi:PAS domain S-box-containing protein